MGRNAEGNRRGFCIRRRVKSAYASPAIYVYSITPELYINRIENNTMRVSTQIRVANEWKTADAMIDSGAMGRFIEPAVVKKL